MKNKNDIFEVKRILEMKRATFGTFCEEEGGIAADQQSTARFRQKCLFLDCDAALFFNIE